MPDEESEWIEFSCVTLEQPLGLSYVGTIDGRDVVRIAYSDVRRIENREVEQLAGIQRPLSSKRVEELRKYVHHVDASFPTGIILAVSSEDAQYLPDQRIMKVRKDERVAKVLDGQHRIAGLIGYEGPVFQLNVTMYVDMEIEDQAMLFSTINLKQTAVGSSLAYDLFEYAESRSPQKTCHNLAKFLNTKDGSPFRGRIMPLGQATGSPYETLTQAAFIDPLIKYVSRDPMTDRDRLRRKLDLPLITEGEARVQKLIFRNLFIREQDAKIAKNLWNYFEAVAKRWPGAWTPKTKGMILNRTTGYRALMRFLPFAYLHLGEIDSIVDTEEFVQLFARVKLQEDEFTPENFQPGSSGQAALFRKLILDTKIDEDTPWRKPTPRT